MTSLFATSPACSFSKFQNVACVFMKIKELGPFKILPALAWHDALDLPVSPEMNHLHFPHVAGEKLTDDFVFNLPALMYGFLIMKLFDAAQCVISLNRGSTL